jgi:hypothetical protein
MSYTDAEARARMADLIAEAIGELAVALAALGAAYEQLDDAHADELEAALFRPVQRAYGTGLRTLNDFGARHGLRAHDFTTPVPHAPSSGVKGFIDQATSAASRADLLLVELQDSLLPIEVGDAELRTGLSQVRELIGDLPSRAREFTRTFGR